MRNIKLTIQYDGSRYHGWQKQKDNPTIQGLLEDVLKRMTGEMIRLIGSGRTDAGVHAAAQTANFHTMSNISLSGIQKGINSMLPDDIAVIAAEEIDDDFHALKDAVCKRYSYHIVSSPVRLPLWEGRAWVINQPIDADAVRQALAFLTGEHDFSAFKASGCSAKTSIRRIFSVDFKQISIEFPPAGGIHYIFTIAASGFLRYMVRNIVGVLVMIGTGKIRPDEMKRIISSKDRSMAGPTAPPQGLYLEEVTY
ncbi:tRNA pseudouridine(38-40) synthase TruA [Dissulfurimicrobium hydrothermale]|uniref:tRNA pseudouridine(38-40) synthase TruA n=1 Tax=Dissulfurimicrobium hydrothermale TaxID=1750598 RepID=UPI001EDACE48|nr:tRNA pseudouridine(38-40) synthase TruA [Dissulfurimicrobium hydrothermale]UKL14164.1 tRNA pseudouridine(38-40) synthase TruA [Dissulfurimicrobium hydrothermale]